MESRAVSLTRRRVLREVVLAAGVGAACLAYLFRFSLLSGGDKWTGAPADARLCMILAEHWWAVCRGLASFRDPNYFYPAHDVLGYSHTLLVLAPLYIPFRAMHFDTYLAFECALAVLKALGFGFCHAMLRTTFRLGAGASLVGATLFTIANGPTFWAAHPQMWIVAFVPVLVLLLDFYFRRGSRGALAGAAFLFGAVMFSEFYTAFFCGLAAVVVAGCWAGIELWTRREDFFLRLRSWSACVPGDLAAAAGPFSFWLVILVWVYYPVLRVTGGRSYADAYQYIRAWRELVDTGVYNWVWGHSLGAFYLLHFPKWEEARMGLPLAMVITAAFAAVRSLMRLWRKQPTFTARACAVVALSSAALYVATVRFGTHTFWWVVYKVVPGASGLRVPGRINVLLTLTVAAVCAMALNELFGKGRRNGATWFGVALAAFLIAEQINLFEFAEVSRISELRYFGRFSGAPAGCEAFYVVRPRVPWIYPVGQVDGMILARWWNIPTINAYGGWPPPGWDLYQFDEGYSNRAARYFMAHGMWDRACAADMGGGVAWAEGDAGQADGGAAGYWSRPAGLSRRRLGQTNDSLRLVRSGGDRDVDGGAGSAAGCARALSGAGRASSSCPCDGVPGWGPSPRSGRRDRQRRPRGSLGLHAGRRHGGARCCCPGIVAGPAGHENRVPHRLAAVAR